MWVKAKQSLSLIDGHKIPWCIFWAQTNSSYFQAKIIKLVDISYGGENGFNQVLNIITDTMIHLLRSWRMYFK